MRRDVQKLQSLYGATPALGLPGFIEDSWLRCLDSYNILPDRPRRPAVLTPGELHEVTDHNEDLIRAATPEVERLFHRLSQGEYLVSLASAGGEKLLFRCSPYLLGDLAAAGVTLGSIWTEETEGTNGIGTSLKIGRGLSIVGDQHFHVGLKRLTCTVAPILGAQGQIVGALNVTSLQPEPAQAVRLLRDITERAATRIEMQLFRRRNQGRRLVTLGRDGDYSDSVATGLLALDDVGRIVDLSRNAPTLLGPQRERICGTAVLSERALPEGVTARWEPLALRSAPVAGPRAVVPLTPQNIPLDPRQTELLRQAVRLFSGHQPILIQGAAGVGKSTFAQALARAAQMGRQPVFLIDGAADPDQITARIRAINPGEESALILDNLADLPAAAQLAVLALLDAAPVMTITVSATALAELIATGRLRADLAHRLSGTQFTLPDLRDAPALPQIIATLFNRLAEANGRAGLCLTDRALAALASHHWPGNLHELNAALRHAVLMAGDQVEIADLPDSLRAQAAGHDLAARSQREAARIGAALQHHGGNVAETARYLGLSRATLYRKIQISKIRQK